MKVSKREKDLKAMHNNYMLQVQSLINQKAIKTPEERRHSCTISPSLELNFYLVETS